MRHSGGGSWGYLALLAVFACSSAVTPPAEGSASVANFCSFPKASISGPGGDPTSTPLQTNQTVLQGRNGYQVSCSVKATGGGNFTVSADISSPDVSLTLTEGIVSSAPNAGSYGTAKIGLWTTQSLNGYSTATPCTITATANTSPGIFKIEPGSIWAQYNCTGMTTPSNLGTQVCNPSGVIVLTGCDR